ncbi:hypothetical protein [Ideonella sp. BN130291]|uniref:hypothetical protein n=1 Tax=Ideonella sp. BN130291 TaxID=3112940 RepID=UPI002E26F28E|nr:hypothetical protein [Ideonella sp. BN130291]
MKKALALSALAIASLALTGCASIIKGGTQPVSIQSVPDGANVTVTNRAGTKIHTGTTPLTVTLNRGAGYFKSEVYTIVVEKEGFQPKEITITGTTNGWYIGNLLFGGLIGMLAVDPVTGAMYSLPDSVSATLENQPAKATSQAPGALTIVSTDALSAEQMKGARLLVAAQ